MNFLRVLCTALLAFAIPFTGSVGAAGVWLVSSGPALADSDAGVEGHDDADRGPSDNRPSVRLGSDQAIAGRSDNIPRDLHLRYPNGWEEIIVHGHYLLIDPLGRTVTIRPATFDDLERMVQSAGL